MATGLVFRNPHPHIRALHAWHPSLIALGDYRWLCSFDLGQAVADHGYGTYLSESVDDGQTWTSPRRLLSVSDPPSSHSLRISRMSDGRIVAFGSLVDPRLPDQELINPETFGYAPMKLVTTQSMDDGKTWTDLVAVEPPLEGPAFETCHAVVELADGRWVAPTSTWAGWDGNAPSGMKSVLLESRDKGRSWGRAITVFDDWTGGVANLELSLVQMDDGRLIAVAWALNVSSGETRPTPYALSLDAHAFTAYGLTGMHAQTAKLTALGRNRLLCVYRRHDEPGLWTVVVDFDANGWRNGHPTRLWAGASSGMLGAGSPGDDVNELQFGYPQCCLRSDGDVELAFWCRERDANVIRWMRLRIDAGG